MRELNNQSTSENRLWLIYSDSMDDYCVIKGYIRGTEEDAQSYCEEYNKKCQHSWENVECEEIFELKNNKVRLE